MKRSAELGGVFGGPLQSVEKFEAPTNNTVKLTLKSSYAPFLTALTNVAIIAPSSFENAVSAPVGSGPFLFEICVAKGQFWKLDFEK